MVLMPRVLLLPDPQNPSFNCTNNGSMEVNCTGTIDQSGDLEITATDLAGNVESDSQTGYVITGDIINPDVISVAVSDTNLTKSDAPGTFIVTVTFNEPMNTAISPTINFDAMPAGLSFASENWNTTTEYEVTYDFIDADEKVLNVSIEVLDAEDGSGNPVNPFT